MSLILILVLALVQGLTEFLPISSSAHLILAGGVLGESDQGLAFDVAAHLGTLLAVCLYFRHELAGFLRAGITGRPVAERRLGLQILVATIPAAVVGWLFHDWIGTALREPRIIAGTTAGFGLLLGLADRMPKAVGDEHDLGWRGALTVGLAQVLALVPGVSRSGITITAALFLGASRQTAARFSFLLAIPVLALAGGYEAMQVGLGEAGIHWREFGLAFGLSAASALACIHLFLRFVDRVGMMPFVIYRLVLAAVLLAWI